MNPVPDPILPIKILGNSRKSNPGALGWQSERMSSNLFVTSPMSQAHSPTLLSLYLRHSSFSHLSVTSPTSLLILQPFRRFIYVSVHSPTFLSLHLCHSSFSNPSIASPTSQFIVQPFFRFSYVTSSSLNSPGEPPMTVVQK